MCSYSLNTYTTVCFLANTKYGFKKCIYSYSLKSFMCSYKFDRQNARTQTCIYSYYFGTYTTQCVYACSKINMCSHTRGTLYMLHVCIHTHSVDTHIYPHVYFGSYVIVILTVKIEEIKEPRVKRTCGISFMPIWSPVSAQGWV